MEKQMQEIMNDARIEWPDSGVWALIANVAGWKSGWARWLMGAWMDRPKRWSGGRYDWNQVINLKQMQNKWDADDNNNNKSNEMKEKG